MNRKKNNPTNKSPTISKDMTIWEGASELLCKNLRFSHRCGKWVALKREPCLKCGNCHNAGRRFDERDRLVIIR